MQTHKTNSITRQSLGMSKVVQSSILKHVKKKGRQHMYDNFICTMFMRNSCRGQFIFPW